jgi:hypothetical protein
MTPVWIAFCVGLFLGTVFGILTLALCVAARQADNVIRVSPGSMSDEYKAAGCLKMYCEDGHEWFGECIPSVCPRCYKPCIGARP